MKKEILMNNPLKKIKKECLKRNISKILLSQA